MSDKQAYEVVIGGVPHRVRYSAGAAKRLGLKPARTEPARAKKASSRGQRKSAEQ